MERGLDRTGEVGALVLAEGEEVAVGYGLNTHNLPIFRRGKVGSEPTSTWQLSWHSSAVEKVPVLSPSTLSPLCKVSISKQMDPT